MIDLNNPDEFTLENVRELIRLGDDSTHSQIRVTKGGSAYLSKTVGAYNLQGVKFCLETLDPDNGYVGEEAAKDDAWVKNVFNDLKNAWHSDARGLVDY